MHPQLDPLPVLAQYPVPFRAGQIEALGAAGGFSGARFWKITPPQVRPLSQFGLRRWPREHPTRERLAMQHAVLARAQLNGINFMPVPMQTVQGKTSAAHAGHLWELTPWLPGAADFFPEKSTAKLEAALSSLASFHGAVADFPGGSPAAIAPSVQQRRQILDDMALLAPKLASTLATASTDALANVAKEVLAGFAVLQPRIQHDLTRAAGLQTSLQPAIRDVHSDHILFEGQTVTGLVDFGALRIDSIAVDIARLLGSMAGDDDAARQAGLNAYQSVRTLDATQLELVGIFDRSTTALSGMHWLRWIYLEGRQFPDMPSVIARLNTTRQRMEYLIDNTRGANL